MTTPADHDKRCPAAWDTSVKCNCGAQAADEIALIEKTLKSVGITSLLNHGAASCVFTEGCCGVSQEHILAYTRKIALHCAVALAAPPTAQAEGWRLVPEDATEEMVRATDKVNFANADTDGTMHNVWNVMLAAAPTSAEGVE